VAGDAWPADLRPTGRAGAALRPLKPEEEESRMEILAWIGAVIGILLFLLLVQVVWLSVTLSWESEKTRGLGYYGLPPAERDAFRKSLRRHALVLWPILRLIGRFSNFTFDKASFRHDGVSGPKGTCSEASFRSAVEYRPVPEDVFVVTQMKCGTTWMQHVVYEVLLRGQGDLVETGTTLYAVSPWIEALKSVPLAEAPLIGSERPSRVIKTHLPAQLCPWSPDARYVYVARHPVSCFASCVDFVATNIGTMAPDLPMVEEWFCSPDAMWWGTWTDHVKGWWARAQSSSNVLFIHFEDMKRDLGGLVRQVADFLGMAPLTEEEVAEVVRKTSFGYMQQHKGNFEMNPPHILQTDAELFVRGTADRHKDVPADVRARIGEWCVRDMAGDGYPLGERYGDLGG
jgi:hypothetical protein